MEWLRSGQEPTGNLPKALDWSEFNGDGGGEYEDPLLVFTDSYDSEPIATVNDFFIESPSHWGGTADITKALLEVMAHKRSRLFGFPLANRFVNVMLPHLFLRSSESCGAWIVQPLVSFIRGERDRRQLRNTYTVTFFLLPVADDLVGSRRMTIEQAKQMTNAGWGYAASPSLESLSSFALSGPLFGYLSRLAKFDLLAMCALSDDQSADPDADRNSLRLNLRQTVERIAFGVALIATQGRSDRAGSRLMRRVGNDVVMALGSARVSSVIAVDSLEDSEVRAPIGQGRIFPEELSSLMATLAEPLRAPQIGDRDAQECRLDRPFNDNAIYAAGVIPVRRCIVVVSSDAAQWGSRESALMQAGSVAYMTLGAAAAIGAMREIDRRLECMVGSDPRRIAEIDREIASDLHEIYDLDITRESYRQMYRRLRNSLGITRDYEILQDKMETLFRATSTFHTRRSERLLAGLTAAIVVLSVFILIGTVALIGKGG